MIWRAPSAPPRSTPSSSSWRITSRRFAPSTTACLLDSFGVPPSGGICSLRNIPPEGGTPYLHPFHARLSRDAYQQLPRFVRNIRDFYACHAAMVNRAIAQHARRAFDVVPDDGGKLCERARGEVLGRAEDRHGWPAERRRNVRRAGVVRDDQRRAREHR